MKFIKIRLLGMVLMLAAAVLLPIYFVILHAPIELVPNSQVINYFYDRRTFIEINKLVANDDKVIEGDRENWRAIQSLRQRDLLYRGTDDRDSHTGDNKLPSEIDQSVEEIPHPPSALSLPPDIVEPATRSEIDANREMIKEDLLSESLDKAVTLGPVDKHVTVKVPHVPASPHSTSPHSTSSPTAEPREAHPHSTQRNHMQALTAGTVQRNALVHNLRSLVATRLNNQEVSERKVQLQPHSAQPPTRMSSANPMLKHLSVSRVKFSPKQPHPLPPSTPHTNVIPTHPPPIGPTNTTAPVSHSKLPINTTTPPSHPKRPTNTTTPFSHSKLPTNATTPLSHPKLPTSATTPLSHSKLATSTTTPLSHFKLVTSATTPLSHPNATPPLSSRIARSNTILLWPTSNRPSKPLTKAQMKIVQRPGKRPSSYSKPQIIRAQPSEKEEPVQEVTQHPMPLPAPLHLHPPQKSLRNAREAIAKSKEAVAKQVRASMASRLSKKARAHRKLHMHMHMPVIANCTDSILCKQLTLNREKLYYDYCLERAKKDYSVNPCQCRLMDGKKRGRYALVSLPGSGNTWVRGLLEKATGVCTGSMWCDPSLRAKHFCMEGVRSTSVLVVKNHDTRLRWVGVSLLPGEDVYNKPDFVGAILIHRDPFSATIAEWNRDAAIILKNATENNTEASSKSKSTSKKKHLMVKAKPSSNLPENITFRDVISAETRASVHKLLLDQKIAPGTDKAKNQHLLYFGKEMFGNNVGWNETVYLQAEKWKRMIEHFIINNKVQPVLVVRYEDLKADPVVQVKRMLKFLKYQYDEEDVEQRLKEGFSSYYRNHTDNFEHYTLEQRTYMNHVIMSVIKRLDQEHITNFILLQHYLRP